ncbi:hypothetical protein PL8927_270134 [Planktothrix serta PCC 8927]|uniref:Lactate/malate dehydrogenase N-terminal domain-containing protein n=1 Tax=Planktothrix serta PCC 8927 TaxID=671068 RepID=A0A7Z9DYQ0_9CYAN|nr:hypothetical protein [Planktothrix serta]VXD13762.1 hypothetical protein PL8927_270134 [Planktothrix serta PCC 8927]
MSRLIIGGFMFDQLFTTHPDDHSPLSPRLSFIEPTQVTVGTVADAGGDANLVIIKAGACQRAGETRLDLVGRNVEIFKKLIGEIAEYGYCHRHFTRSKSNFNGESFRARIIWSS